VACLAFTGQLVSQVASAPLSATLSLCYWALSRSLWRSPLGVRARPHPAGKIGATTCMVLAITVLTSWRRSVKVPGWLAIADAPCLADVAISRRGGRARARPAAQPGRAMSVHNPAGPGTAGAARTREAASGGAAGRASLRW
jgi:hypothetical protein